MSLKLWLPFNGNANNQGLSSPTISVGSSVSYTSGKIGKCITSSSSSNNTVTVTLPDLESTIANGKTYSLACWVKPVGNASGWVIKFGTNSVGLWWGKSEDRWVWNENDNGKRCANPTISGDYNNWHHLVTTVDKTVSGQITAKHYVDGSPAASYESHTWDNSSQAQPSGNSIVLSPYYAYMCDVRFYDHCLSPKEVKELSKGLVLHYPLTRTQDLIFEDMVAIKDEDGNNLIEETSGDAILEEYSSDWEDSFLNIEYDVSGHQRNGINYGTTYSSDTVRYLTCTSFNGITDGVVISNLDISNILNDQCTISFWIKPDGENGARSVYFSAYNSTSWSIEKNTSNKLRLYWNGNPDISTTLSISDGEWQHIVITKNGTSDVKVYLNGELIQSLTNTHSNLTFGTTWRLGRDTRSNDGTPYKGLMSDFRIYSTALDADGILALYNTPTSIASNGTLMTQGELLEV